MCIRDRHKNRHYAFINSMNAGDKYEKSSYDRCYEKGFIFPGSERGGSSSKADLRANLSQTLGLKVQINLR